MQPLMKTQVEKVVAPRVSEPMKEVAPSLDDEILKEHDMLEP